MFITLPVTEVPCSFCGRGIGEWCMNSRGIRLQRYHRVRVHLAAHCRTELKRAIRWAKMDEFQIFFKENMVNNHKISVKPSPTADTRSCDCKKVSASDLYTGSVMHVQDVMAGLRLFSDKLLHAGLIHDNDKRNKLDLFHANFVKGFRKGHRKWLDDHYVTCRHHLHEETGIPSDVNLLDVLEMIVDWTMAGVARSGKVRELHFTEELLEQATQNTIKLLVDNIQVEKSP